MVEEGRKSPGARGLGPWLVRIAPRRARGVVTIAILSDRRVEALNGRFRGVRKATDVLSFPSEKGARGKGRGVRDGGILTPYPLPVAPCLGDIAIARGVARTEERKRIMFLDGITKSLGGSNIRNCHLIADETVVKFILARASHGVIPSFFSLAVAMSAYEMGFTEAAKTIIEPTNASRVALKALLLRNEFWDRKIIQNYKNRLRFGLYA